MTPACRDASDAFYNGFMLAVMIVAPIWTLFLYWIFNGLSTKERAQRRYKRRLDQRAAEYMDFGYPPSSNELDAYDLAKASLRSEADKVRELLREKRT